MSFCSYFSIVWLLSNLLLALPLVATLYRHIKKKSLVSVTLVDLIYKDTIVGIYLMVGIFSVSIIHGIIELERGHVVEYSFAAVYAGLFDLLVLSLSILLSLSGCLRLLSLVSKSEVTGLHILGPDSEAIFKARLIALIPSLIFEYFISFYLNIHPVLFDLLHEFEPASLIHSINTNPFKGVSLVMMGVSHLVNLSTKCYSLWSARKLTLVHSSVFTIEGGAVAESESPTRVYFSLPLGPIITIPLMVIFGLLSSYADRKWRLWIFCPLQTTAMIVLLPLFLIYGNEKIKKDFDNLKSQLLETIMARIRAKSATVVPRETSTIDHP